MATGGVCDCAEEERPKFANAWWRFRNRRSKRQVKCLTSATPGSFQPFRHGKGFNFMFCDGHMSLVSAAISRTARTRGKTGTKITRRTRKHGIGETSIVLQVTPRGF